MEVNFNIETLPQAVAAFLENIGDNRIFLFEGEMGSGKTTFIAEICRQLGALDDFGSPTFSIVNEYQDRKGNPIYHFDFYRLDTPRDVADMGALDYFDSGELCFVEWPDRLGELQPEEAVKVEISVNPDSTRTIKW